MTPFLSSDADFLKINRKTKKRKIFFQKSINRPSSLVGRSIFILLWGMENLKEKACLCALNRIFGFEPKVALGLISQVGSASTIFELGSKELDMLTGPYFKYKGLICPKAAEAEMEELEKLSAQGISFCGWTDDNYPELLKECEDPPVGLYIRSSTPAGCFKDISGVLSSTSTLNVRPLKWYEPAPRTGMISCPAGTEDGLTRSSFLPVTSSYPADSKRFPEMVLDEISRSSSEAKTVELNPYGSSI